MNEAPGTQPVVTPTPSGGEGAVDPDLRLVSELTLPSEPGNERAAMESVASVAGACEFPADQIERIKTAVSEATLNALEHGNHYRPELEVRVEVLVSPRVLVVRITDQGSGGPPGRPTIPDLDAKLSGEQSPRGWGLFLIQNMVDDMRVSGDEHHHVVELTIRRDAAEGPRR
jgi:anti-sigma regulatory factor (Ser/Thr protein kinase)